jgi:hypothetical protein
MRNGCCARWSGGRFEEVSAPGPDDLTVQFGPGSRPRMPDAAVRGRRGVVREPQAPGYALWSALPVP